MRTEPSEITRPLLHQVIRRCSRLRIPVQVTLELTYRCNLRCAHCYVDLVETDGLSLKEWQGVIDQLKSAGTIYLLFTGGEIMVRPDFLDIASYARRNGFFIAFLTNCTLVTPAISQAIAQLRPFLIGTSLYGATAATHELVTKVPSSFRRTLEGIKRLVSAGLVPVVQITVMKANLAELPRIKQLVENLGAVARFNTDMTPSKTGSRIPLQYQPDIDELLNCSSHQDILGLQGPGSLLCQAGRGICSISPNGDIFPCIMFPMKLGNLKHSTFNSIWRLKPCAERRYLRSMRRSDLYACMKCERSAYCQRCAGIAYIESGRVDGSSPSACRQAQTRWQLIQATEVEPCQKNPT